MLRTVPTLVVISALALAGCAGGDDEAEAKEAISAHLMKQQEDAEMLSMEQDEADCISEDMVDGIGVDRLTEYGFLDEDGSVNEDSVSPKMEQADAEVMVDAMFDCTDVMATMQQEMSASLGDQPEETRQCFEDALTEEVVRTVLVATFTGEEEKAQQELMGPLGACLTGAEAPDNG